MRYSPNHHRGLAALVRLSLRDKTPKPVGVDIPVECYLLRALEFTPTDAEVHKIYGTYLARLGRDPEAIARFEQAEKLLPDDAVVAYNLGLLLTEKRDFERARMYAEKAYAGGVQLLACETNSLDRANGTSEPPSSLRMATLLLPPAIHAKQPSGRT